jgi:hypothetical protein
MGAETSTAMARLIFFGGPSACVPLAMNERARSRGRGDSVGRAGASGFETSTAMAGLISSEHPVRPRTSADERDYQDFAGTVGTLPLIGRSSEHHGGAIFGSSASRKRSRAPSGCQVEGRSTGRRILAPAVRGTRALACPAPCICPSLSGARREVFRQACGTGGRSRDRAGRAHGPRVPGSTAGFGLARRLCRR